MTARRRIEIASYGFDETKQIVGTNPYGGSPWLGLRVPTLATRLVTPAGTPQKSSRYLFLACAFSVGVGSRARLIGYRQYHAIGCAIQPGGAGAALRPVVVPVTTPGWSFPDATVSYHFRRMGPPNAQGLPSFRPSNLTDSLNLRKGFAMTPALLYQSITLPAGNPYYVNLTAYTPPNGGRPFGTPLTDDSQRGTLLGLATDWKSPHAWSSLDVEIEGPETVACFISVAQTDPTTAPQLPTAQQAEAWGLGIAPEDAFCINAQKILTSNALQWAVGASMIVEVDSLVSEVRAVVGGERNRG